MQDFNDLYYFAKVVEHGGFSPAARALGLPKSRLGRRVALLEQRLGVRLIQRSTSRFFVTDIGQKYLRHCAAMIDEAGAAQAAIELARTEPGGAIKLSCPIALLHARVADMLTRLMLAYPALRIRLEATNRRVDVIGEGIDVALRARFPPIEDSDLVVRTLGYDAQCLVACARLFENRPMPATPADLATLPSVAYGPPHEPAWHFEGARGELVRVEHAPRLVTDDITLLLAAVASGVGVAVLPRMIVQADLDAGKLAQLLPEWRPRAALIQAVFPTRRGMLPAVRHLVDFLADEFARDPMLKRRPPPGRPGA